MICFENLFNRKNIQQVKGFKSKVDIHEPLAFDKQLIPFRRKVGTVSTIKVSSGKLPGSEVIKTDGFLFSWKGPFQNPIQEETRLNSI